MPAVSGDAIIIGDEVVLGSPGSGSAVELPFDHPRILWDDVLRRGNLAASSQQVGFEPEHVANYLTYDFWKPAAIPATLTINTDVVEEVDYFLIAAHTLGSSGTAFVTEFWDGATWQLMSSELLVGSDRPIAILMSVSVLSAGFRLRLTSGGIPSIGVFMVGKALAVERKLYNGHTPINLSKRTIKMPNKSEGGQWLGTSIRRQGSNTSISFANLTAVWVREKFEPFIESAQMYPFGWVWRPEDFPEEVAYCATVDDIRPTNTGPAGRMGVTFQVDGLVD